MGFLKRDLEEEEIEKSTKAFRSKRKLTTPELIKRRKEPLKPWTKTERYWVLGILLTTVFASVVLALSAREWKLPGLPRFSLPKLGSWKLFKSEPIIFEGENKSQETKLKVKSELVINNFRNLTKDLSGVYGLYIIDLTTGYSFGIAENEIFPAASLIKLPVMIGMYQEEEHNNLSLETKYQLKNSDKLSGAGSLSGKPQGYELTYRDLIRLMAKQSDNTAFGITKNLLGEEKFNEVLKNVGMTKTSLSNNETSPRDIGLLFESLWWGNLINSTNKDELLDYLSDTIYEAWLTPGLPEGTRIAHKYGREIHVINDAGIVYSSKPYIVVIMTKGVVEREADEIFPQLSKIVYEGLTSD